MMDCGVCNCKETDWNVHSLALQAYNKCIFRWFENLHKCSQGVQVHPQGEKNIFGVIYTGKLQSEPQAEEEVIFLKKIVAGWAELGVGVVNLAVLAC